VGVVQEAGMTRVFQGAQSAASDRPAIDRQRFQPGLAEIGLQDESVVPGPEDDAVMGCLRHVATTISIRHPEVPERSEGLEG
jgi:hypothetical protein